MAQLWTCRCMFALAGLPDYLGAHDPTMEQNRLVHGRHGVARILGAVDGVFGSCSSPVPLVVARLAPSLSSLSGRLTADSNQRDGRLLSIEFGHQGIGLRTRSRRIGGDPMVV